jgi:hypothetical protein
MAAKRRKLISPAHVRPPPTLPAIGKPGLRLSRQELATIRRGMALHAASLRPKLTWHGWRHIALACAIGTEHLKQAADGRTDTPIYIRAMHEFLKGTGFCFLNKDDRAAAVRLLPHWDQIDAWRSSLSDSRQQALNNPREVERAYGEHRKKLGGRLATRTRRQFPSVLEQLEALAEQLEMANERGERAEHEAKYFAAMMDATALAGKLDDDAVAKIRAKARAAHARD